MARYAFNEILDDTKTTTSTTPTASTTSTTASATIAVVVGNSSRFDLKVRPGIERKNPRDNTFPEVPGPFPIPGALFLGLDDPLALRFFRPVMNSNEWKNRKVPAARRPSFSPKFLLNSWSRFYVLTNVLHLAKRNGRPCKN